MCELFICVYASECLLSFSHSSLLLPCRIPVNDGTLFGMQHWLDTVHFGPLVRSVRDAALYLDIVSGYDPSDPKSLPKKSALEPSFSVSLGSEKNGKSPLRIGYSTDLGGLVPTMHPEIRTIFDEVVQDLQEMEGIEISCIPEEALQLPDLVL